MKILKSQKPVRLRYIQVNTKEGIVRYSIYKTVPYGDMERRQKFYADKHGVEMNMVGAAMIARTKELKGFGVNKSKVL